MVKYLFQDFKKLNFSHKETLMRLIIDSGCLAVFLYRLSSWFWNHKLKAPAIAIKRINTIVNACDIPPDAEIGAGLRIFHAVGVVMADIKAGTSLTVWQNVTIGIHIKKNQTGRCTPIIGNNVSLYAGCIVAGQIVIGNNVQVGANSVVFCDIPSNSIAYGNPLTVKDI